MRSRTRVALGLGVLVAGNVPAAAQTRFEAAPAVDSTDFTRHLTPQHCLAAAYRIRTDLWNGRRRDTLMVDPGEASPPEAVEAARRCGARFTPASVEASHLPSLFELALMMNDDSTAAATVARRVETTAPKDTIGRAEVLASAVRGYMAAHPARVSAARRTTTALDSLGEPAYWQRKAAHAQLMDYAWSVLDTALSRTENKAWLALMAKLPPETLRGLPQLVMMQREGELLLLDGIAHLTADTYIAGYRALIKQKFGATVPDVESQIQEGTQAPPLRGDVWFNRPDSLVPRPTPGRWSLIVNVDHECEISCYGAYAMLRRLHQAYGSALDITLVAQTRGFFRGRPLPTPAQEAEWLREYVFDYLKLPGALVVAETPFIRKPEPDRRVTNLPVLNNANYRIKDPEHPADFYPGRHNIAFLVDPKGRIVRGVGLNPLTERQLRWVFDAFLGRTREGV